MSESNEIIDLGSRDFNFTLKSVSTKFSWLTIGFEELQLFTQELITKSGTYCLTINVKEIKA